MGTFNGGAFDDIITPSFVSLFVVRSSIGALPGAGADTLVGSSGNDSLDGGGGIDVLLGAAGEDTLVVAAGGGFDGGDGDDRFLLPADGTGATITGGAGQDTLDLTGPQDLTGMAIGGVEVLVVDADPVTLTAAQLNDIVQVNGDAAVAATINLATSGLVIVEVSGLSSLTIHGTADADDIFVLSPAGPGPATAILLEAGLGDDSILTFYGEDTLNGGAGNDTLSGGATGANVVNGGDGDDQLFVAPNDTVNGGGDDDVFLFELAFVFTLAATIDGGDGVDRLELPISFIVEPLATLTGIETLLLGAGGVTLSTTQLESFTRIGASFANTEGTILLSAGGVATTEVGGLVKLTVLGSNGNERLVFTQPGTAPTSLAVNANAGNDTITTGDGADLLDGGAGNDSLRSGGGNDTLSVQGGDRVNGGDGSDLIILSGDLSLATTIVGGTGVDSLDPVAAAVLGALVSITGVENLLLDAAPLTLSAAQLDGFTRIGATGGAIGGTILLSAAGAATTEVGGLQTLSVTGTAGNEALVFTQPGTAPTAITVAAGAGNDTITTGDGNDSLDGGEGQDSLRGGLGRDTLSGGAEADTLNGGDGRDLILGGAGADNLRGGTSADVFRYDLVDGAADTIADFEAGADRLQFDAGNLGGGLVAGALGADRLVVHASNLATGPAGTGQFVFNTATSVLLWDVDGSGGAAALAVARLVGVATLSTAAFDILA